MPSGKRFTPEIKRTALEQYYSGEKTVSQICAENGIAWRTIYSWIEKDGHGKRAPSTRAGRATLRVTRDEAELILLMCAECEKILPRKLLPIMRPLETRVLDIADELTEMSRA